MGVGLAGLGFERAIVRAQYMYPRSLNLGMFVQRIDHHRGPVVVEEYRVSAEARIPRMRGPLRVTTRHAVYDVSLCAIIRHNVSLRVNAAAE